MRWALLLACAVAAHAETPRDVLDFFRTAAEALSDQDPRAFLAHFDPSMKGYVLLSDEVAALANLDVSSTLEFASDEGDDRVREMDLDWLLRINGGRPRREILHCKLEKQGKKWRITALDRVEFFAAP